MASWEKLPPEDPQKKFLARTLRGKREAAKQGRYMNAFANYGYCKAGKGAVEVDPAPAESIRLIFGLPLKGRGIDGIVRELARRHVLAPHGQRVWSKSTIRTPLAAVQYVSDPGPGPWRRPA